jgi:hypothetical protein
MYQLAAVTEIDAMQQFTIASQQERPHIGNSARRFGRFRQ